MRQAIDQLESFLARRNAVDTGHLQGWYEGDFKLNVLDMIEFIRKWKK